MIEREKVVRITDLSRPQFEAGTPETRSITSHTTGHDVWVLSEHYRAYPWLMFVLWPATYRATVR